jgi:hypothetical protein
MKWCPFTLGMILVVLSISCNSGSQQTSNPSQQDTVKKADSARKPGYFSDSLFWGMKFGMSPNQAKKLKLSFVGKGKDLVAPTNLILNNPVIGDYVAPCQVALQFTDQRLTHVTITIPSHTNMGEKNRKGWKYQLGTADVLTNLKFLFEKYLKLELLPMEDKDGFDTYHREDSNHSYNVYSKDWDIGDKRRYIFEANIEHF